MNPSGYISQTLRRNGSTPSWFVIPSMFDVLISLVKVKLDNIFMFIEFEKMARQKIWDVPLVRTFGPKT